MEFVLHELLDIGHALQELPPHAELDADTINQTIDAANRFAREVLAPLNSVGDAEGCRMGDGGVITPTGFPAAYRGFVDAGWPTISAADEYGGQNLPMVVTNTLFEMFQAANLGWCMFVGIAHGAYKCLHRHGAPELRAAYLPHIVSGKWTTTMCLSEASCGSDLGLIRSHALPQEDGSYRISGSKIFISGGDHDMAENIVHLVLARLPGAPAGSKGISLFLVPKYLPQADGTLGMRNSAMVTAVEHKMGLRGSPTCVVNFDGATGWLVGEPHRGLAHMFTMMNEARIGVGIQALGVSQRAHQNAVDYARERLQMRSARGPARPSQAADPIMVHADVRRMLLTQKAWTEGARMLLYWLSLQLDIEAHHPDAEVRAEAADLVALLTPVAKAFLTDNASETTNLTVQVFGGHGYIVESGVEQFVRDARIQQIYEGTNGIQSQDLLGRKVLIDGGKRLAGLFKLIDAFVDAHRADPRMREFLEPLIELPQELSQLTQHIGKAASDNADEIGAAGHDYLRIVGHLVFAYLFARAASISLNRLGSDDPFYAAKLATARFYFARLLPETKYHLRAAESGAGVLAQLEEGQWFL
jgi:alkylation response protein AidB-like acyl-CoA dehydrogenase